MATVDLVEVPRIELRIGRPLQAQEPQVREITEFSARGLPPHKVVTSEEEVGVGVEARRHRLMLYARRAREAQERQ